jgi:P-type E1-E2 ATPase
MQITITINVKQDACTVSHMLTHLLYACTPPGRVPACHAQVPIGSWVVVRPGDRVPLDGRVVSGTSLLDEAMLTGETRAVSKDVGAEVFGGTINVGQGTLVVSWVGRGSKTG